MKVESDELRNVVCVGRQHVDVKILPVQDDFVRIVRQFQRLQLENRTVSLQCLFAVFGALDRVHSIRAHHQKTFLHLLTTQFRGPFNQTALCFFFKKKKKKKKKKTTFFKKKEQKRKGRILTVLALRQKLVDESSLSFRDNRGSAGRLQKRKKMMKKKKKKKRPNKPFKLEREIKKREIKRNDKRTEGKKREKREGESFLKNT